MGWGAAEDNCAGCSSGYACCVFRTVAAVPPIVRSLILDLLAVAVFVTVGRASHGESLSPGGLVSTGWPFAVGVLGGHLGAAMAGWAADGIRGGSVVLIKTLIIGLVLRYGVQREGTPLAFILVTVLVLALLMGGWRLADRALHRAV